MTKFPRAKYIPLEIENEDPIELAPVTPVDANASPGGITVLADKISSFELSNSLSKNVNEELSVEFDPT